jgi:putative ABC transport system permease protein
MLQDFKYGVRTLLKSPAFAALALVTLAVGIGANTAIFTVVNGVLLRPLPFHDPEHLMSVFSAAGVEPRGNHSAADFIDLQNENQSLAAVAGYRSAVFNVAARPGEGQRSEGAYVTLDFFDVLGIGAANGRVFSRAADGRSHERLVVISQKIWQQLLGSRPEAVGERIRIDGEPYTVAGVLPKRSEWPEGSDLWLLSDKPVPPSPIATDNPDLLTERDVRYFSVIARIRAGVTLAQARQDVERVGMHIQQQYPQSSAGRTLRLVPLFDELVEDVRDGLYVLQAAVGLVLLIACANVSSLLLARATGRKREMAIRAAIGGTRARLVRQLLTESLVLGTSGGLIGLLLGSWLTSLLVRILPEAVPRAQEIAMDRSVAALTFITAVASGAVFGAIPALQASRADAASAMKRAGDRGSAGRARGQAAMVVVEIALTVMLLVGAGLLVNSFLRLQRVDSGMRPENVTVVDFMLPAARYGTDAAQRTFYERLLDVLSHHTEFQSAGVGFPGPLRGSNAHATFFIEGRLSIDRSDRPSANLGSVSGDFFSAMGVPILAGRTFTAADRHDAPSTAIVSQSLARKYWPDQSAVGKRLRFEDDPKAPWFTIVGVVGDIRQLGLDRDPPPILYIPYQHFPLPFGNVAVRSRVPTGDVAATLRAELATIDPDVSPGGISTLQAVIDHSIEQPRFRTALLMAFAAAALLLAAVGVYGLVSYSVAQRTREIGIRVALGARSAQVLLPILREGFILAVSGITIGLVGALLAARYIATFLFGVGPADPLTFAAVAGVLLIVALLASFVPSRRALKIDPIMALRAE